MKRPIAALLGAASLVPAACGVTYVPAWLISGELARLSAAAMYCWLLVWIAFLAVTGYFVVAVLAAKDLAPLHQLLWLMALLAVAPIAAPVYWWLYVRPRGQS